MEDVLEKPSCKGCGAGLDYSAGAQALTCPYCGALTPIARAEEEAADGPRLIVPLTVEQRDLEQAVHRLLASGDYTPDDLLDGAVLSRITRFYAPAYLFRGRFETLWSASFGYDRTEHYTDVETRYTNGQPQQVSISKTRTVTDWQPAHGADTGSFAVFGYAGTRLSGAPLALVEQCAGRDGLTDYRAAFASGIETEPFALTDLATYAARGEAQVNELVQRGVLAHAQGNRQRDWHWTFTLSKTAVAVAVPVCHVVYLYQGRSYNVWADGTDARRLVSDPLPRDRGRYYQVLLGFVPALAAAATLAIATLLDRQPGLPPRWAEAVFGDSSAPVFAALGFGFLRRYLVLRRSRQLRQALLAHKAARADPLRHGAPDATQLPAPSWLLGAAVSSGTLVLATIACCALVLFLLARQGRVAAAPAASPHALAKASGLCAASAPVLSLTTRYSGLSSDAAT